MTKTSIQRLTPVFLLLPLLLVGCDSTTQPSPGVPPPPKQQAVPSDPTPAAPAPPAEQMAFTSSPGSVFLL